MDNDFILKVKAVVVGHAVGDALGVPVEFIPRNKLDNNPVTDMTGYGTYTVPKGAWSDDTSMSLCALDALARYGTNCDRIMINFGKWYYRDEFTPTGKMFDVGNTCAQAIDNYFIKKMPSDKCGMSDERSNGNGSLMRIHPFALYALKTDRPLDERIGIIHSASSLTHAHRRSLIGCGIYAFILWELLVNADKESVYAGLNRAREYYLGEEELGAYERLFSPDFKDTDRALISSSGYIVHSLEAALWCLLNTENYKECVLKAVNLGDDTDTVAAVAGGLAGALYGYDAIPEEWLKNLIEREYIEEICSSVFAE